MLKSQVTHKVTLFGNMVFTEVIRLKWGHSVGWMIYEKGDSDSERHTGQPAS